MMLTSQEILFLNVFDAHVAIMACVLKQPPWQEEAQNHSSLQL